jgi:DNA-binding transcriptional LysR family regulator
VRRDHPTVGDSLSAAQFASLGHIEINRWGSSELSGVDRWLEERGLGRRVAVTATGMLTIPDLLSGSDLVVTVGERVAQRLSRSYPLRIVEPPFGRASYPLSLIWHRRDERDSVHRWFRRIVTEVGRDVAAAIDTPPARR